MTYVDVLVVGGGLAGLTAASYLSREGLKVTLCEQSENLGGLLSGYTYEGFYFDTGVRSLLNAGLLKPMIKELDLELSLLKSRVSLGFGEKRIEHQGEDFLENYLALLGEYFPKEKKNLKKMKKAMERVSSRMEVIYGTDNPLFVEDKDPSYLLKELLPWLLKYKRSMKAMEKEEKEVRDYLSQYTKDKSLLDMITQHFFKGVPASFALGYFYLYGDYYYPRGGTQALVSAFEKHLEKHKVEVYRKNRITVIDAPKREALLSSGEWISYSKLIWACDEVSLYRDVLPRTKAFDKRLNFLKESKTTESIFGVNMGLCMNPKELPMSAHHFFTPNLKGLHTLEPLQDASIEEKKRYLKDYLERTTFELSVPDLRDESLQGEDKLSLQVSTILDYDFFKKASLEGQEEELKNYGKEVLLDILEEHFYPSIKERIESIHVVTPLSYERRTLNFKGAISGWSFDQEKIPSLTSFKEMRKATFTEIPHIFKAGQWSFSPAGIPVAILTGKLAATDVLKALGYE